MNKEALAEGLQICYQCEDATQGLDIDDPCKWDKPEVWRELRLAAEARMNGSHTEDNSGGSK